MTQQGLIFLILAITLGLFIWGRFRFDLIALCALLVATLLNLVPGKETFAGLGHPAVITVAAVLVISKALQNSGIIEVLARRFMVATTHPLILMGFLTTLGAILSGFMNNVGALALLMPVAINMTAQSKISPALVLMPLSFGTILGGLMTMIGTPPNIIIATYRADVIGSPFTLFDFSPIGVTLAIAGVLFVSFIGWRLIPKERSGKKAPEELFEIKDYIVEARISEESSFLGLTIIKLEEALENEIDIVGLLRGQQRFMGKRQIEKLEAQAKDILIIQANPNNLQSVIENAQLELIGEVTVHESDLKSENVSVVEAVIKPGSKLEKRTFQGLRLRSRYGIALLGISRQGKAFKERLNHVSLRAGDILLFQGETANLMDTLNRIGCLPLAGRGLQIGTRPSALWPILIFAGALTLTAMGYTSVHIAFVSAIVLLVLLNIITMREAYESIDWPIIILLAAMIPLGQALETTGGTTLLTNGILGLSSDINPVYIVALLLVLTMTLSDIMNNAATAVVMAPIAVGLATQLHVNPDPFLMAVAIGASCAFLTPIGHQNNILVMGPGGYKFGDYWRLGLPLELMIIAISVPLICIIWPL